ncbi:LAME_0E01926g1_1 [Lachancea meyersii CBS 8951]|uniref:LAME_0E01926g1_1 n=1 Tax=Lachancea meyersii CBS 8951 TaxID=1266667 RepID=A0A1G4JFH4_9SACH|nr:LAME_0E01926g1_1 [Lachancea meyersii CBS 8951]
MKPMKRTQVDQDDSGDFKESKKFHPSHIRNRETSTVVVKNLPSNYNFFKVRKLFSECGDIEHIEVVKSLSGDSKLARIEFKDYNDVLTALTKSHKSIGSNEILVEVLQNSTIWVTNFPPEYDAISLRQLFNQAGGTVLSTRFPSLRFDAHRRFAYVDLASPDEAQSMVEQLQDKVLGNYKLVVKLSKPTAAEKRTDCAVLERRQVIIKNLDQSRVTQDRLLQEFSRFGKVEKVTLLTPRSNGNLPDTTPKLNSGFAFIEFADPEAAQSSLKLDKCEIEGATVHVNLADRKAYLERQAVKRLLSQRSKRDHIVSVFPLDDKTSVPQLQSLISEQAKISPDDLRAIYLVYDHEGALIVAKDTPTAAKLSLALGGIQFKKKTLHCGDIKDLKNNHPRDASVRKQTKLSSTVEASPKDQSRDVCPKGKMTNEDFRRMFFAK